MIESYEHWFILSTVILLIVNGSILPAFAQDDYYTLESRAAQMYQQGNYTGEIPILNRLLQEHPADPLILGMKEHVLIALGQYQDALNILNELIPIANTQSQGFLYYQDQAIALYHLQKYQDAQKAYSDYTQAFTNAMSGHLTNPQGMTATNYIVANIIDEKIGNPTQAKFDKDMYYQLSQGTHFNLYKTQLLLQFLDYPALVNFANSIPINDTDYQQIQNLKTQIQGKVENVSNPTPQSQLSQNPASTSTSKIPAWVKNIFIWYGQGKVSEDELLTAVKFLIHHGIIKI